MILSLFLILFGGIAVGTAFGRLHIPALIGYLALGLALGAAGILDESLLAVSADLRRVALVVILLRAGLSTRFSELKKSGSAAVLLCFFPALAEMCAVGLIAPLIFPLDTTESFLLGSVLAAVSPAVVVPRMLSLSERGLGSEHAVPQTLTAGASADDIFVVLMFGIFLSAAKGGGFSLVSLWQLPVSIVCGVAAGVLTGIEAGYFLRKVRLGNAFRFGLLLALSLGLAAAETALDGIFPFSVLLGVMACGMAAAKMCPEEAERAAKTGKGVWEIAEIFLFILVGAAVSLSALWSNLGRSALLLLCSLAVRSLGVLASTLGTKFTAKERVFCMLSYLPKATVQAAIGGIALSEGLACGETVLSVAVAAIILTAPTGAAAIELSGKRLLLPAQCENGEKTNETCGRA